MVLSLVDKWNVLKNLLYYGIKFSLVAISELFFDDDCGESLVQILQSIFNYVKHFERMRAF
jgi:hypothetical protein